MNPTEELVLEVNEGFLQANDVLVGPNGQRAMITPPIDGDYWLFRVAVSDAQAVVGFPKFGTIGVGFQHEDDWNTNLPYGSPAIDILNHISHNKGDESIPDSRVLAAIKLIQEHVAANSTVIFGTGS